MERRTDMPELPEIETIRRVTAPQAVGRRIADAVVYAPGSVGHPDAEGFRTGLVGRTIDRLDRRGKFLTAVLGDGSRLVMHMRMTGCLTVAPPGYPEDRHTRIVLVLDDGYVIRFSDMRRFGRMWLFGPGEDDGCCGIGDLGPEPDDPGLTAEYMSERLGHSSRAIKECLLDQTVVAGIGNIYSDEILFSAGIDPATPARRLTAEQWGELAVTIPERIRYFTETNSTGPEEFLRSGGKGYRNTPYLRVYGQAGEPCPVCGATLVRRVIGGRGSVSCPVCQPAWGEP